MTEFDPAKNMIQYAFLGESERNSLRNWPWGWDYYSFHQRRWLPLDKPFWCDETVYRGLPKLVVTSEWFNIYPQGAFPHTHLTRENADEADCFNRRIAVLRIDACNGVKTAHLEVDHE